MGKTRKTSRTNRDLITIVDHIGKDNPAAGYRFFEAAEQSFELLAAFPLMGTQARFDQPNLENTRLFPIRGFEQYLYAASSNT